MDISPTSLQQLIVDEVLITRCRTVAFRNCVIIGAFMSVERLQTLDYAMPSYRPSYFDIRIDRKKESRE